jgi:flagellar hook-associated protein 2
MGTVGLSFGSATSGTGFDVTDTVTSILAIQQATETPLKTQLTALQAQDTVFTTLGTDLATLSTSLQALTDATGTFAEKQGSSSDTNVLTLTSADSTAVAGSHTVIVNSLAATASKVSDSVSSASDTLTGSITINGQAVSVAAGTAQTLTNLSAAINLANIGVTSRVITDANGSRLSLTSDTSGAAGSVTVTSTLADNGTAIGFTHGQAGANASLSVDGIDIASASNTVTGAIPGVTFQLLSSPGTSVQIQVTNDNTAIEAAFTSLTTAYNAVIKDINAQEQNNATTGAAEPLYGDPTLSLIQTQLQAALFGGAASGSIKNLAQLGISVANDGTLSVDTSALDTALNANFSDITGFLQNSGSFGQSFSKVLNSLGNASSSGAVSLALSQNSAQETAINASITTKDAAIAAEKVTLTAELNTANQELQAIPQQIDEINQIYSAVTGYNQNLNG